MEGEQNSNMIGRDDELQLSRDFEINDDSKSADSNNRNSTGASLPKRKRYNRHTSHQIQLMESFFKECPHPDERQRRELSRDLGMEPMQVKFWFQNKRTQMKTQHEHKENNQLRTENEKLRAENMRYREVLSNASCPTCGGPTPMRETSFHEQQLRIENARLREEIDHISTMTTKYASTPMQSSTDAFAPSTSRPAGNYNPSFGGGNLEGSAVMANNNGPQNEGPKLAVVELASAAMEELLRVAQMGDPLWVPSMDRNTTSLNEEEYFRSFGRVLGPKQTGFKSEATRETVVVAMNAQKVIEILMDVEQWSTVFSGVVSRASNLQVISPGVFGTYSEALQLMNAEFHVSSPIVPTRESYFLRYCRQDMNGTWTVVDVSLDQLLNSNPSVTSCRKRPSGCIVQDIPNGHSKVIWVEHVEVEEGGTQSIYKPFITAGLAFGARRWVSILDGYCKRVASAFANNNHPSDLTYLEPEGRQSMLKLAGRMVGRFCGGANASAGNTWSSLSGNPNESVKILSRKNVDDPTMPFGIHLCVATSFWLPISPRIVFDFLRDHHNRTEWDTLTNGGEFQQLMKIASGNEVGDRISIYQVKGGSGVQGDVTMLQESRSDPTASYVVYAPIDMLSANAVLGGGDPGLVPLLPSGFVILPDGPIGGHGRGILSTHADTGGSLLTIALQVVVNSGANPKLSMMSISAASKLITSTVENIKHSLVAKSAHGF